MTRRLGTLAFAAALLAIGLIAPVAAQEGLDLRIREASLDDDGTTQLIVSVDGIEEGTILGAEAFSVSEQGELMSDVGVEPLLESRIQPLHVALAIDVSGSMGGQPMEDTRDAAAAFAEQVMAQGIRMNLIAFSATVDELVPFTDDVDRIVAAIEGLEASGTTLLYDAVVTASERLAPTPGQHNLVVFSDGADNGSSSTLEEAVAAAQAANAPVLTVALETDDLDPAALETLAAETGGSVLSVDASGALSSAFDQVAQQLASQYVLTYSSAIVGTDELDIAATVTVDGAQVSDEIVVINPRTAAPVAPEEIPLAARSEPLLPFLGNPLGFYTGVAAGFLALALLLGVAITAATGRDRAGRVLTQTLEAQAGAGGSGTIQERTGFAGTEIAAKAREIADMLPKPEGFEEDLQIKLERGGWKLRSSEFIAIAFGTALAGFALVFLLTTSWMFALVGLFIGALAPKAVLAQRIRKREAAFLEQLPETLQLLAGSLRAGYGILQAIDTVVKEAAEPTASEFARALGEARLGMPLDEALETMAERVGSADFRWVVLAMNIQRQVGGNLADLLETIANTLRDRAMVRRQIKTLSAEGRLSAIILVALPIVLGLYMFLVNTTYMLLLFTRTMGLIMMAVVGVLMVIGVIWMKKLIDIEV